MPTARFSCFGVPVSLSAATARGLARLIARLPPGARRLAPAAAAPRELRYWLGLRDGEPAAFTDRHRLVAAGADERVLLDRLESHLALRVATQSQTLLFVHAAVVAWRGRALILPGRSMAGKSTLTAALVRAGATYLSDEYALLDERGRVHPYARPLWLRSERAPRRVRPRRVATRPLPVGKIVLCRYRAGAALALAPLSPGRAVLALFKHTVPARAQAATAMERLTQLALAAPALSGVRGEAQLAAEALLRDWL